MQHSRNNWVHYVLTFYQHCIDHWVKHFCFSKWLLWPLCLGDSLPYPFWLVEEFGNLRAWSITGYRRGFRHKVFLVLPTLNGIELEFSFLSTISRMLMILYMWKDIQNVFLFQSWNGAHVTYLITISVQLVRVWYPRAVVHVILNSIFIPTVIYIEKTTEAVASSLEHTETSFNHYWSHFALLRPCVMDTLKRT